MAVIKYKSGDTFVTLTNYTVQPIVPVQTSGTSLTDVMSQKAVSDGLEKKVDNDELDGKIADAIAESDAVISAITKVISGDSAVSGAVETIVTEKLENYYTSAETKEYISGYTYSKGDIDSALSGKSDVGHTHVVADITDFESGVSSAITNNGDVISSITNVVSSAITSNTDVISSITQVISSNTEVEKSVNNVISSFTDNVLDGRYAFKQHTHQASAITDFDSEVAQAVKTEITNNNSAITESIENVIEKYIYGEGGASSSASVVTTENLETTLADYAKTADIPTDLSGFTNSPKYIKENDINGLIASAITDNQAVIDAVNSAITSAITSDTAVQNAIDSATANKFGEVEYDSVNKRINFYATSAKTSVIDYIDATAFIKDGMVDNVAISGSDLVITFNTDAGKEPISLALTDIFDPNNYYTRSETSGKSEISMALDGKSDTGHTHTASQITDFNAAVSGAVKNNTDVKNEIISAVTASTEFTTINNNVNTVSGNVETISGNVNTLSGTVTAHTANTAIHFTASSGITSMAGYAKAESAVDIATGDTLNAAIGKLEKKIDSAVAGGVSSVVLGSGSTNGSITLSVNGSLQNTISVPGLGGAAFLNTGTTAGTVAAGNHTHLASEITDFNSAVSGAVKNNADVKTEIISAVTSSTEFTTISGDVYSISGDVNTMSGNVTTISGAAYSAKAVTDFMSGHNNVDTLASIPTDKRLVIATITASTNTLSLSNNSLTDGYEIHVIVKNNGEEAATVTLPDSGGYVSVGEAINIAAGSTGEINIISDGTNLYVRGA